MHRKIIVLIFNSLVGLVFSMMESTNTNSYGDYNSISSTSSVCEYEYQCVVFPTGIYTSNNNIYINYPILNLIILRIF